MYRDQTEQVPMAQDTQKQQEVLERLKQRWTAHAEALHPDAVAEDTATEELALNADGYPETGELNRFLIEVEQFIPILTPNPERANVRLNARKLASSSFVGNLVQWLGGTEFDPETSTTTLEELEQRIQEVKLFRDLLKGLLTEVQMEVDGLDSLIQIRLAQKTPGG